MQKAVIGAFVACLMVGCTQQSAPAPQSAPTEPKSESETINQADLCEVQQWQPDDVAASCKAGQKVVFLPDRWGNEQLPVIFAAVNCDLRYSVVLTNGAVTCIYGPITPRPALPQTPPAPPAPLAPPTAAPAAKPGKP